MAGETGERAETEPLPDRVLIVTASTRRGNDLSSIAHRGAVHPYLP